MFPCCELPLALLLCTQVLYLAVYDVMIAHAGPQGEGSICMIMWQEKSKVYGLQQAYFLSMAPTYVATIFAEPCPRKEDVARLGYM